MNARVLLLTPWVSPFKVISWEEAVTLEYLKKVFVLSSYDETISSPSITIQKPAVVQLKRPLPAWKKGIKFSRIGVFTRDAFRCQYCGLRKDMKSLNYDHVIPRVKGGLTNWQNIVASCYPCNEKKGKRMLNEAGMKLLRQPFRPHQLPMTYLQLDRKTVPQEWLPFLGPIGIEEDHTSLFLMTA